MSGERIADEERFRDLSRIEVKDVNGEILSIRNCERICCCNSVDDYGRLGQRQQKGPSKTERRYSKEKCCSYQESYKDNMKVLRQPLQCKINDKAKF